MKEERKRATEALARHLSSHSGAHLEQWEHQPSESGGVSMLSMLGCTRLRWVLLPEGWPSPVGGVGKPLSQQQYPSSSAFSLPGAASFLQSPPGYVWHASCWKDQNYSFRKTQKGMKNADILLDILPELCAGNCCPDKPCCLSCEGCWGLSSRLLFSSPERNQESPQSV